MRNKESEGGIEKKDRQRRGMDRGGGWIEEKDGQRRGMDREVAWIEKDREAGLIDKKFDNI